MQIFKIPEPVLSRKYQGAGMAIAAVTGGQIVNLVYFRDLDDDVDEDDQAALMALIENPRIGPTIRELQAQGELFVGMCSCTEFIVR